MPHLPALRLIPLTLLCSAFGCYMRVNAMLKGKIRGMFALEFSHLRGYRAVLNVFFFFRGMALLLSL